MNYEFNPQDMYNMNASPEPKKKVQAKQIPFVKLRKYFLIFTAVCFVLGLAVILIRGFAWDTDFIGGTSMQINIGHELTKEEIAEITSITEEIIKKKVSNILCNSFFKNTFIFTFSNRALVKLKHCTHKSSNVLARHIHNFFIFCILFVAFLHSADEVG